jgi:hypothetical protein
MPAIGCTTIVREYEDSVAIMVQQTLAATVELIPERV